MPGGEGLDDLIEESRRQEAVVIAVAAADLPNIIAGPIEFVALGNDDPGPFIVKPEMALDRSGNFNRACWIAGRRMRDRENHNDCSVVRRPLNRKHDDAGTIFPSLFPSRFMLAML